ncbi:MAG: PAS domain-containing protein [Verrucomicrobiales bacterium]|nr:PAS domain-containing protein [Verrucomicrobiales bacterium]
MKIIRLISDLPIRRKLTLLLLTPCIVVLLVVGAALVAFQLRFFKAGFTRDVRAVAEIVGANSTAAISFNDPKAAAEILESLRAKDHIEGALLLLPDGSVLARYGAYTAEPMIASEDRIVFRRSDVLTIEPVVLDGTQIATLNMQSDFGSVYAELIRLIGWMVALVALVGAAIAALLSTWLQHLVSDPILRLAQTARTVGDHQDYSVRAREESSVEMGVLTRTFNQMLARIELQDGAITLARHKMEALVNSIDGIVWECDADDLRFSFVSRQSALILGYPPEQWLSDADFWCHHLHPDDAERATKLCRESIAARVPYLHEYRMIAADERVVWIREIGSILEEGGRPKQVRGLFLDITAEKLADENLDRLNRRLLETSRLAGMAEVATSVLHNVGNVLNSVSVSATVVRDRLRDSRVHNLRRATAMLREHDADLLEFLAADPRGKRLPEYLDSVSEHLTAENASLLAEVAQLGTNVEHIKEIVARQQDYATVSGVFEKLAPKELVDDALRINLNSFERHRIELVRDIASNLPLVQVDRHKALQILVNLFRNAKQAIDAAQGTDRRLFIQVTSVSDDRVAVRIRDTGIGIAPQDLTRIFEHGFTTKKGGHGFGLHSSANAAREIGGNLTAHSDGPGKGAEFTLELRTAP